VLLQNHSAVIYGGGGAIGGAVARVFAREGARVFVAGRTPARLDAVAAGIAAAGGTVETAQVDAFDQRAVEQHADPRRAPLLAGPAGVVAEADGSL
jgi:NADP-dependent 3-hydroxy acid dehydrogenase YdfG